MSEIELILVVWLLWYISQREGCTAALQQSGGEYGTLWCLDDYRAYQQQYILVMEPRQIWASPAKSSIKQLLTTSEEQYLDHIHFTGDTTFGLIMSASNTLLHDKKVIIIGGSSGP